MLTVGSLFSGIGGFELGLERTGGFKTVWQCEIDPFCQKVLAKHWPDVKRFSDIKEMVDVPYVDVICGGFPCQPVSCAGKRKGDKDERWLWPEFYRIVCEVKPQWVLVENVPGLLSADFGRLFAGILRDLASSGYDAEWNIVSAAFVGAPHLRKRVFVVAHAEFRRIGSFGAGEMEAGTSSAIIHSSETPGDVANSDQIGRHGRAGLFWPGRRGESENSSEEITNASGEGLSRPEQEREHARPIAECDWWAVEPELGGTLDGFPAWLDGHLDDMLISHKRLIAYGVDEDTTSEKSRSREVLRILRDQIREESNQRSIRGLSGISETEVLLSYLCKLSEASETLDNLSFEGAKTQENILRGVQGDNEPRSPPHRPKSRKQRAGEHTDALQEVSRLLARDSQTAWASYRRENAATILSGWLPGWEDGIPRVANGVSSRVDRLRSLGNAIVPQCSEFVGRCVLEAIS